MSDITDEATEREQQLRDEALRYRKPVPTRCERCNKPAVLLHSGAISRFCREHLVEHLKDLAGDLDAQ